MTVGSWEPNSDKQTIDVTVLKESLLVSIDDFPAQAPESLNALQPFAKSDQQTWQAVFEHFDSTELKQLCRFFTLAEAGWMDWFGGDKNPVIWICKELKTRGDFPDKDLTAWIKQNTENRFLPYGNVLG
jgi:hypothetical protein